MAFSVAKHVVEGQIRNAVGQVTSSTSDNSGGINWSDYNFPPCLNLVHFSLGELQGTLKRFVLNIYLSFLIVVCVLLINILSTIIQASKYSPGIEVFYSFLNLFIFTPAAGFTFYRGYSGACKRPTDSSTIMWYKLCQGVLCVLWFVFSIIMAGSFDGWMRIGFLKKFGEGAANFCIFLTVLEALGYTASLVLGVVGILQIDSAANEPIGNQFPMPPKV